MTDPIREEMLAATASDDELQELRNLILQGWPNENNEVSRSMKKYWTFRDELTNVRWIVVQGGSNNHTKFQN